MLMTRKKFLVFQVFEDTAGYGSVGGFEREGRIT